MNESENLEKLSLEPNGSVRNKLAKLLIVMAPVLSGCDKKIEATNTPAEPAASVSTTASTSESPIPTPKPTASIKAKPVKKEVKKRVKQRRKLKPTDKSEEDSNEIGSTIFLGDSLTYKLGKYGGKLNIKDNRVVAKGGKNSQWLLDKVSELAESGELSRFENAVVLIGTNDIGRKGDKFTKDEVFERIEDIYQTLLGDTDGDGTADIDGVDRVYGATIPPFKGENNLSKEDRFERINDKRIAINSLIRDSEVPFSVIDLAAPLSKGGIADNNDPDKFSIIRPNNWEYESGDGMHFPKIYLRLVYEKALRKNAGKTK